MRRVIAAIVCCLMLDATAAAASRPRHHHGPVRKHAAHQRPRVAAARPEPPVPACAAEAASTAGELVGLPYRFGGTAPETGFDCAGLTRYVFENSCGVALPRSALAQYRSGAAVGRQSLQPGDLVFFRQRRRVHVGIYIGANRFVHSPNHRRVVSVNSLDQGYYSRTYVGGRRVRAETATADSAPPAASDSVALENGGG